MKAVLISSDALRCGIVSCVVIFGVALYLTTPKMWPLAEIALVGGVIVALRTLRIRRGAELGHPSARVCNILVAGVIAASGMFGVIATSEIAKALALVPTV